MKMRQGDVKENATTDHKEGAPAGMTVHRRGFSREEVGPGLRV